MYHFTGTLLQYNRVLTSSLWRCNIYSSAVDLIKYHRTLIPRLVLTRDDFKGLLNGSHRHVDKITRMAVVLEIETVDCACKFPSRQELSELNGGRQSMWRAAFLTHAVRIEYSMFVVSRNANPLV